MPITILPQYCTPSPVSELELARRRELHGLDAGLLAHLTTLRRVLARRGGEIVAAASAELAALPAGALCGAASSSRLVGEPALDHLVAAAVDREVATERCRLGALHAWCGLDAHALGVVTEAIAQAVEEALERAGAGREGRACFRRVLALDQGLRMDGYAYATAQLGVRDVETSALRPEAFLRALDRELHRAFRRAEPLAVVRALVAPTRDLEDTLRALVRGAEASARRSDLVGRTGGQELCVALPGADLEGSMRFLSRWLPDGHRDLTLGIAVAAPGEAVAGGDLIAASRQVDPVVMTIRPIPAGPAFEVM